MTADAPRDSWQPLTVAVTGHRPNRLHIGEHEAARRIAWVLSALRAGTRRRRRLAISSLAEGADRLFAELALARGYALHAALPFASRDYETTFADTATTPRYHSLLARAATVTEMPGTLAATKAAYEATGRASVDAAVILVAVWDGKPAAGRGGTPDIIEYALHLGKPVIWIDAARLRLPRLVTAPSAHGPAPIDLDKLATRAKVATRRKLATLAGSV